MAAASSKKYQQATDRWSRPLVTAPQRWRAWLSLLFADHGFLRPVYWNFTKIDQDVWRGPQPNPLQIKLLKNWGLSSIINLRGPTVYGSYALEKDAAARHHLHHRDVTMYSGGAPRVEQILALHQALQEMPKPILLHCKSGADRAGLASALYLLLIKQASADDALKQLSLRYGHVKSSKTGVLDAFIELYKKENQQQPIAFLEWVQTKYKPDELDQIYSQSNFKRRFIDALMRRE